MWPRGLDSAFQWGSPEGSRAEPQERTFLQRLSHPNPPPLCLSSPPAPDLLPGLKKSEISGQTQRTWSRDPGPDTLSPQPWTDSPDTQEQRRLCLTGAGGPHGSKPQTHGMTYQAPSIHALENSTVVCMGVRYSRCSKMPYAGNVSSRIFSRAG